MKTEAFSKDQLGCLQFSSCELANKKKCCKKYKKNGMYCKKCPKK
jgi:hypothetical protein